MYVFMYGYMICIHVCVLCVCVCVVRICDVNRVCCVSRGMVEEEEEEEEAEAEEEEEEIFRMLNIRMSRTQSSSSKEEKGFQQQGVSQCIGCCHGRERHEKDMSPKQG
jgi:hypothetical protein